MSIVSAGILGTSSFQQNSDDMVIANEIKFLSSYIYVANNRLSQDYYAINTNSTNDKQKGSIWAKSFDKDTAPCQIY